MCGADPDTFTNDVLELGSPPRVRSRLTLYEAANPQIGITSACAEQTEGSSRLPRRYWDHLRVCGADSCILLCSEPAEWRGIFDLRTA